VSQAGYGPASDPNAALSFYLLFVYSLSPWAEVCGCHLAKRLLLIILAQNCFDLLSMGAVKTCSSSVLNGNLISE